MTGRALLRLALGAGLALAPLAARAQGLGDLVSPGRLAKAHAKLEGIGNCQKCHEPGKRVTPAKCLACHQPIAERIAARKGVHRAAGAECAKCHAEHAGEAAELRPFDPQTFDHAKETGFALQGLHTTLACAGCHRTRSFLGARPACASCHEDVHKGALGADCASCHAVTVRFRETRRTFDHAKTAFALTGAHVPVKCEACHQGGRFRGVRFASCADCHKDPHKTPLGTCASCHTTESFRARKVDHGKTAFPLAGRHAALECQACHVKPATQVKLKFGKCADCHEDVHRGAFREDCASCHKETGFRGAPFDHRTRTAFALDGRHAEVPCARCHEKGRVLAAGGRVRSVDFKGLRKECASCHADVHKGTLGADCASCHGTKSFRVPAFRHPRHPEFFAGAHAAAACERCHAPAAKGAPRAFTGVSLACASCHRDVHLGQVGSDCARCHAVSAPKFDVVRFDHAATKFPLTAKHAALDCAKCHRKETGKFPAGDGTAVRLTGLSLECRACHKDVHLGQLGARCETCHATTGFEVRTYTHQSKALASFFTAGHASAACAKCHRPEDGDYPAGRGKAVRFTGLGASECARCHADPHKGAHGSSCASCHVTSSWQTASRDFHKATTFPLEGRHLATPCASCHWNGALAGTPRTCVDCHWIRRQDDRFRTRLGTDCVSCHSPISWKATTWNHGARTGFVLNGAHAGLRCEQCHANERFAGTQADCFACHATDYRNAKGPDHVASGFPTTCQACHRPSDPNWHQAAFRHDAFPLAGAHATTACAVCHNPPYAPSASNYTAVPTTCVGCHQRDYASASTPVNHVGLPTACDSCHKSTDATWLTASAFSHATYFPLAGAHVTATCATCHNPPYAPSPNNFTNVPTSPCVACHQTDYNNAKSPLNHATAGFPTTCDSCHKFSDPTWMTATFTHATYPLTGVHATTACTVCHNPPYAPSANNYTAVPTTCVGCHQRDYASASTPVNHVGLPTACDSCHKSTDATWLTASAFSHAAYFPLAGAHLTATCATCHNPPYAPSPNNFTNVPTSPCVACHQADYNGAKTPVDHVTAGFPTTCDSCHKFSDPTWTSAAFTHATFPLVGVHAATQCAVCHNPPYAPSANNYASVPTTCVGCHQRDYASASTPVNHVGLPTACDSCHKNTDATWLTASAFSHATYFPLAGAHVTATCATCHNPPYAPSPNNFTNVPTSPCVACHQADYNGATSPVNHVTAGFPTTCDSCHKFSDPTWMSATFTHATYPLVGVHAATACAVCHNPPYAPSANNYTAVPTTCVGCHQRDYASASTPVNHVGLPTACDSCHKNTDATWLTASAFSHATYFPLAGAHATATCTTCHNPPYAPSPNNFTSVPTSPCVACHLADYNGAKTPVDHVTAGFPTTCDSCHKFSDTSWLQATFTHATFPLVGVHAATPCAVCHNPPYAPSANNYTAVPTTCVGCHQRDYASASTPVNHVGLPTACDSCHKNTDATWLVASAFNHATYFPLAGAHVTATCATCHNPPYAPSPNNFTSVPTSPCVACHLADYNGAKTPVDHVTAAFPTTCDSCHKFSDTSWLQATFTHATYPLVGVHATTPCAVCHNPPYAPSTNNYTSVPTTCVGCHQRDYASASTPVNHVGLPTACDSCHKNTDATWLVASAFNHAAYFPLAGVHAATACAVCHNPPYAPSPNNFTSVPTTCVGCHQADYATASTPVNHAGLPTSCDSCHRNTDATWLVASAFSHAAYFPLAGAHATSPCLQCHNPPYAPSPNNFTSVPKSPCVACHLADYNNATSPVNHIAVGFPTTCDSCHKFSDTSWLQAVFNHTWFPTSHGGAAGVCATCHTNPSNFSVFTCTVCHGQAQTNLQHVSIAGYVWSSPACYSCHPTGGGGNIRRRLVRPR